MARIWWRFRAERWSAQVNFEIGSRRKPGLGAMSLTVSAVGSHPVTDTKADKDRI
jgi:hypothetical protein